MVVAVFLSLFIDLALGEPKTRRHPVALLGSAMAKVDTALRSLAQRPVSKRVAGAIMAAGFVGLSFFLGAGLVDTAHRLIPGLGWAAQGAFIWLSISIGELVKVTKKINLALGAEQPQAARALLRSLVGRDPDNLDGPAIRIAALESLAENLVDAGIAPLFYACIGGGPLAFAYRVLNTMDSMFGYKNETYVDFGWAAARLDDMASWLPARLTVVLLSTANRLSGRRFWPGIKAAAADGRKHPSPNSGLAMAALAGSLDIRLGGERFYQGSPVFYGYFGRRGDPIGPETIDKAAALVTKAWLTSAVGGVVVMTGARWLIT